MKKEIVVLLSGGIDSTTCLAFAVNKVGSEKVLAVSIGYGQKHIKELQNAKDVANYYGVELITSDLSKVFELSNCSLLQGREDIKHESYSKQLEDMGGEGTVATYVPFRNGLMLAQAASIAISVGASEIFYGAHADDAAGRAYPDCTPEFSDAMNRAIYEGSGRIVSMFAPLLNLNKAEVVELGDTLGAPYRLTWSCYEGGIKHCGTCGTCIDRKNAFILTGIADPTEYEV